MTQSAVTVERYRVPVEHRIFGLDRRTLPFAGVALAVWVLWAVIAPAVDDAVPWSDEVRAGDVLQVTPTVTMVPTPGWGIQSGLRTTDRTSSGNTSEPVVLTADGIAFQVTSGPWTGTPAALLNQSTIIASTVVGPEKFRLTQDATTIQTRDGRVGVLDGFSTPTAEGLIAALVFDGTGLQIQVVGQPQHLAAHARDIAAMIVSISDREQP